MIYAEPCPENEYFDRNKSERKWRCFSFYPLTINNVLKTTLKCMKREEFALKIWTKNRYKCTELHCLIDVLPFYNQFSISPGISGDFFLQSTHTLTRHFRHRHIFEIKCLATISRWSREWQNWLKMVLVPFAFAKYKKPNGFSTIGINCTLNCHECIQII